MLKFINEFNIFLYAPTSQTCHNNGRSTRPLSRRPKSIGNTFFFSLILLSLYLSVCDSTVYVGIHNVIVSCPNLRGYNFDSLITELK